MNHFFIYNIFFNIQATFIKTLCYSKNSKKVVSESIFSFTNMPYQGSF